MPVLKKSRTIDVPIGELYQFHCDTRNLGSIQPPGFRVVNMTMHGDGGSGTVIDLTISFLGLRQHWEVELTDMRPPTREPAHARVVDEARHGPFPYWRHQHIFHQQDGSTRMTDLVDYDPPGGPLRWLVWPFAHFVLHLMFAIRQARTARLLARRS